MKIEFEIVEADLVREVRRDVEATVKKHLSSPARIAPLVERTVSACIEAMDLRDLVQRELAVVVEEIVRNAVNGQLRHIAKTIVQQEIEKVKAAATQPATVR